MIHKLAIFVAIACGSLTGCSSDSGPLFPFSESGRYFFQKGEPMVLLDGANADSWRGLDINLHPPDTKFQDHWRARQAVADGQVVSLDSGDGTAIVFPPALHLAWVENAEGFQLITFDVCPNVDVDSLLATISADATETDVQAVRWISASDECVLIHSISSVHDVSPRAIHLKSPSGEYEIKTRTYQASDGTTKAHVYDIAPHNSGSAGT